MKCEIRRIGLFSTVESLAPHREELLRLAGALPVEERSAIAAYLRSGAIVTAPMEYTMDVIGAFPKARRENLRPGAQILDICGGRFAVPGGSGILTDGVYGWRQDTADYVEHYGVGLPDDFLQHGRSREWRPVSLTEEEIRTIYDMLDNRRSRGTTP